MTNYIYRWEVMSNFGTEKGNAKNEKTMNSKKNAAVKRALANGDDNIIVTIYKEDDMNEYELARKQWHHSPVTIRVISTEIVNARTAEVKPEITESETEEFALQSYNSLTPAFDFEEAETKTVAEVQAYNPTIESIAGDCKGMTKILKPTGVTVSFSKNNSTIFLRKDKKVIFGIAVRRGESGLIFWNPTLGRFGANMLLETIMQAAQ